MDLHLHNSWVYEKEDWWNWNAYLTGTDLPKVDHVEYILHPSFKKPVRTIGDPADGFKLESAGWGTFELKAMAYLKDGTKQLLSRKIQLEYKPKKGNTEGKD